MRGGDASARGRGRPPTERALIEVEHLSKFYGATRALEDVSFRIAAGETVGLLGPNGSGKSTLIRCLVGYFAPTRGRICIAGRDVVESGSEGRRVVGYLPEQVVLYPDLSVEQYLRFAGRVKGLGGRRLRREVDALAERCGLRHVLRRPTGVLSKGYRQRVGIAQALLGSPPVLVLDEPGGGLDPVQAVELRELIRSLDDRTVLVSTHLLGEAAHVCDRVVILRAGRLLAEDTPEGLARRSGAVRTVSMRLDGPTDALAAAVRGVVDAQTSEIDILDDGIRCVLRGLDARAVQQRVTATVVAAGWTIREIREEEPMLEDLFLRLVE